MPLLLLHPSSFRINNSNHDREKKSGSELPGTVAFLPKSLAPKSSQVS
jgi:hypothetical protein